MAERKGHVDFNNQKQLRLGRNQEAVVHLSGDTSRDDRVEAANQASVIDAQPFLGFPFMHPMHDAAIDQQLAPRAQRFQAAREGDPQVYGQSPGRVQNALGANEVPPGQAH